MKDWQERVVDEKRELDSKLESLVRFIGSEAFPTLPRSETEDLLRQKAAMVLYSDILAERIATWKTDER